MNDTIMNQHLDDIDEQLETNPGDGMGELFNGAFWLLCEGIFTLDDYLFYLVTRGLPVPELEVMDRQ